MIRQLLTSAAIAAVAIGNAAPANADDVDYVLALDDNGIPYNSSSDVIDIGKMTCSRLRSGMPITITQATQAGNPDISVGAPITKAGYAPLEAAIITVAAANNMCPDTLNALANAAAGSSPLTAALQIVGAQT